MDAFILAIDRAARTLSGAVNARRESPASAIVNSKTTVATPSASSPSASTFASSKAAADDAISSHELTDAERAQSIALMRVNHAGEVAAQALYQGQALFSRNALSRENNACP
jgi:3-demethoxyubiquinol 3-hydroxylase